MDELTTEPEAPSTDDLPPFHESSIPAVRLLRGVVYSDDEKVWDLVLSNQSRLETQFAGFGLRLVIDEPEGYAYLRQIEPAESGEGYEALPRLFRKSRLGYELTVLCVLLRDELRRFEDEELHSSRCIAEGETLFENWRAFLPTRNDESRLRRDFASTRRKAEDLGFLKSLEDGQAYEVRRIIKARITPDLLEELKEKLAAHVGKSG